MFAKCKHVKTKTQNEIMKLRTKLTVKMWLLRSACVMSIASACIWAIPIFHGDYYAGLTGIALSYILAILAAGFSWATEWDLEHIDLLIDEEVEKQIESYDETHSLGNKLIEAHECMHKELDDDLAKHTAIFKRYQTESYEPFYKPNLLPMDFGNNEEDGSKATCLPFAFINGCDVQVDESRLKQRLDDINPFPSRWMHYGPDWEEILNDYMINTAVALTDEEKDQQHLAHLIRKGTKGFTE